MLTHFSLFSGIGGIDLAASWAGFTTVGFCEIDPFCQKILKKHWPDVPIWGDIRSVTADSFRAKTGQRTVDLISGGFPCQPYSVAGKRKAKRTNGTCGRLLNLSRRTYFLAAGGPPMGWEYIAEKYQLDDEEAAGFVAVLGKILDRDIRLPDKELTERCFMVIPGGKTALRCKGGAR